MTKRRYIPETKLRSIAFDVRRIIAERKRLGDPPATVRQLSDWTSHSEEAIRRALKLKETQP